jgi:hypothetical protein
MKRSFILLVLFFSLSSMFSDDYMKIIAEKTSINVPLGWQAEYKKTPYIYIVYSPAQENATFRENYNLTIEKLQRKYSVSEYYNAAFENLKKIIPDIKVIDQKDNYYIYTFTYNNVSLQQLQYIVIKNNNAYIVTFSSTPETFDNYKETFLNIAKSFEILK